MFLKVVSFWVLLFLSIENMQSPKQAIPANVTRHHISVKRTIMMRLNVVNFTWKVFANKAIVQFFFFVSTAE